MMIKSIYNYLQVSPKSNTKYLHEASLVLFPVIDRVAESLFEHGVPGETRDFIKQGIY
ncbi:MAG: hypothetical protein ACFFD4_03770 [Candidatus Odinarchaeota archaeon]